MDNQQHPPAQYYYDELDPEDPYAPASQNVGVIYQQQPPPQQLPSADEQQQQQQQQQQPHHHHPESMPSHPQYVMVDHPMQSVAHSGFVDNHNMPLHIQQPQGRITAHHPHSLSHNQPFVGIEHYQQHHHHHHHPQLLQHPQPHPTIYGQRVGVTPISVAIPVNAAAAAVPAAQTPIVPSTPVHHIAPYTPVAQDTNTPPPLSPEPPSPHHSQSSRSSELASYGNPFPGTTPGNVPGHQTPNTTPSSGAPSPSPSLSQSSRSSGLVHRSSSHTGVHRYRPTGTPSPTQSQGSSTDLLHRRHSYQSQSQSQQDPNDSDQDILDAADEQDPPPMLAHAYSVMPMHVPHHHGNDGARKEATRRQRIEAEQRRRDELREGYARLKDVLPVTNMKSSKVSLLERAVNHILHLTHLTDSLQTRLAAQDNEINRLRMLNERIALTTEGTPPIGSLQPPLPPQEEEETITSSSVKQEHHDADRESLVSGGEGDDDFS